MKTKIVWALFFVVLIAAKCERDKLDLTNAPFTVNSAKGEKLVGGEETDGEQYRISFQIDLEGEGIEIDSMFYRKQTVALYKTTKSSRRYYVASVKAKYKGKVRKAFKDLNDISAILIYHDNGRKAYYMVSNITMEESPIFQP